MSPKRLVVMIALLGMLATTAIPPRPAYADITTALAIAGAVTGAYVAVVFIATAVHRRSRGPFLMPEDISPARQPDQQGLRFGPRCTQKSTTLTLVCW